MKFRHATTGTACRVELLGDLDAGECNCLEAFWDCHVGDDLTSLDIDMSLVDDIDAESVAVLTTRIRQHLADGTEVTLHRPPQMLAHTLYKVGLLDHAGLTLIDPRSDEQHAT
ncbi:MAG TPA: STAS domain-containing protein, partial [Phycisphaerae bacterium]|nr:STAS domain-containing protein [Phycisphaerales bacterium]HRX87121.1 STAS domain-containing protein [Phycisphaerae bacterium]